MLSRVVLVLLATGIPSALAGPCPSGGCKPIAGYTPGSDVTAHANIELDLKEIKQLMALGTNEGWTEALEIYENGKNSLKSSGKRSIQGFSTAAKAKMTNHSLFSQYWAYVDAMPVQAAYADLFVRAAMEGTVAPGSTIARQEMAVKGASYLNIWMYINRELEDAVADCKAGDLTSNDDKVHAWDEGWAFYAGVLEGESVGGDKASSSGLMPYRLAEKRCVNFGTCENGVSRVNTKLLPLFEQGRDALLQNDCDAAHALIEPIRVQMTIPLIQGALRYAWLGDPHINVAVPPGPKSFAEGWAFTRAVLPQVAFCNPNAAEVIRRNMEYGVAEPVADGHGKVWEAFESTYRCLGITCADIGAYDAIGAPRRCEESSLVASSNDEIAGYKPGSSVVQHNRLDLDTQGVLTYLKVADWDSAKNLYLNGKNSLKSSGTRTLAAFSDNDEKMEGMALADMYAKYWGNKYDYAHDVVMDALANTGNMSGAPEVARRELAQKTIQYSVVWMYVVWEMQDAVNDCMGADLANNDAGVHAWDEAWAFYTGSLEGTAGKGNGVSLYALADKRCKNFGTCASHGGSRVNENLLGLFQQGEAALRKGKCVEARVLKDRIIPWMTIPLIQGALRYAYKVDAEGASAKSRAEGWAFAAAVLPQIHAVNPAAAAKIRRNMDWKANVQDGYREVFQAFQSVYNGLMINCLEVGGVLGEVGYHAGTEPCVDLSTKPHMPLELHGAGATLPSKLHWKNMEVLEERLGSPLTMSYRAVGTAAGQEEFLARTGHFSGVSVPLSPAQRAQFGLEILTFPHLLQSVSLFHNIPDDVIKGELNITAEVLVLIFRGDIRSWNHPRITELNPELKVASVPIKIVRDKLPSSSTYYFTRYLAQASNEWTAGYGMTVNWPQGSNANSLEREGQAEMAKAVESTYYSIGYLGSDFGLALGLKEIKIKNRAGTYLTSDKADLEEALNDVELPENLDDWSEVSLINKPGKYTWPITTFSYILVPRDMKGMGETGHVMKAYLEFMMSSEGQQIATTFGYTKLPTRVTKINKRGMNLMQLDPSFTPFTFEDETTPVTGAGSRVFSKKRRQYLDYELEQNSREIELLQKSLQVLSAQVKSLQGDNIKTDNGGMSLTALGSCDGRCGKKGLPTNTCYCDTMCHKQTPPDCCDDMPDYCPAEVAAQGGGAGCSGGGC